jgi:hypothetical protein
MKKPLKLGYSPVTNKVFAFRDYKIINEEAGVIEVTGKKENITDEFLRILRKHPELLKVEPPH